MDPVAQLARQDTYPITVDGFSRLVSEVYSAVITAEQWDKTIVDIGRAFDGASAALVVTDGATHTLKYADIPSDAVKSYAEHYARIDHVLSAVQTGPTGAIRPGAELMWPYQQSEFATDWARPNGFEDGMFVRLVDAPHATSLVLAAPRRSERFDSTGNVALVHGLVPHLQQALRIQDHLDDLTRRVADLAAASETVRHGIIVVASDRRPVFTNSAADLLLCSADGLRIRNGRIESPTPQADARFQHSITGAIEPDSGDIWGGLFACARGSGRQPYTVHVLPLDPVVAPTERGRAIIVVVDPERQSQPAASLLRRLYGLTNSEANIALMVTRAEDLKPIADELSVSVTTVKTHLRHIFEKTGTHRQADLVRLLLSVDPLCRQPDPPSASQRDMCIENSGCRTGLRPDPFPDQAASLLPGLLTATRTGLPPASDDELHDQRSPTQGHLQSAGRAKDRG